MSEPKRYYDPRAAADKLGKQLLATGQKASIDDLMLQYEISEPEAHRLSANLQGRATVLFLESVQSDFAISDPQPIGAWDQSLGKFVLFEVEPKAVWDENLKAFVTAAGDPFPGWQGGE